MNKKSEMLRNWINGLLGNENQTKLIVNDLVNELLKKGFTGFKSEYIDYPNGETYKLELKIKKVEGNVQTAMPITVNVDADEVMERVEDYVKKNYYGNWKPKKKE